MSMHRRRCLKPVRNCLFVKMDKNAFPKLLDRRQPVGFTGNGRATNRQLNILNLAIGACRRSLKTSEAEEAGHFPQPMNSHEVLNYRQVQPSTRIRPGVGPFTQQAVLVAIDFLRRQPFVSANKVALFGYSRGAIVAAMVATQDPGLAAVVLGAGAYDFFNCHPTLPGIARNRDAEADTSADAFMARSAIYHAEQIKAPVLVLHGAADERIPVQQAEVFAAKLKAAGVRYRIKIYPGTPHGIPFDDQYREVFPFLDEFLR